MYPLILHQVEVRMIELKFMKQQLTFAPDMLLATQVHLSSEDNHVGLQINQYFVAMI
jgi:hypothetical protein